MPEEFAALFLLVRGALVHFHVGGQNLLPRTLLILHQLYSHLHLLERAGVDHPDDFAASFLALVLHADYVANFQFRLDAV